jgi:hypothetical protein
METITMDLSTLSEADKHLIYGLLLKKKRSRAQDRKVLSIVRSSMELGEKIQAIVNVTRVQVRDLSAGQTGNGQQGLSRPATDVAARGPRKKAALVIDARPEITRLLKKCSLKRELSFTRANERFDALHLVLQLRPRLVVVNEMMGGDEEYPRYFEICRAIEPGVRIIYLGSPPGSLKANPLFHAFTRFLPKPLNIERLEESVRALLAQTAPRGAAPLPVAPGATPQPG